MEKRWEEGRGGRWGEEGREEREIGREMGRGGMGGKARQWDILLSPSVTQNDSPLLHTHTVACPRPPHGNG